MSVQNADQAITNAKMTEDAVWAQTCATLAVAEATLAVAEKLEELTGKVDLLTDKFVSGHWGLVVEVRQ